MTPDFASHFVVISGPSGAGKDTIAQELIRRDSRFSLSCSATTREPRAGEVDGEQYYFIDRETFDRHVAAGDFIEYAHYGKNSYGTLRQDVEERIRRGKTVLLVIEVQGAENIRRKYPGALTVFIMPPSVEKLEQRLRGRGTDSDDDICRRMGIAAGEMEQADRYDAVVVNDILEDAVDEVYRLITEREGNNHA